MFLNNNKSLSSKVRGIFLVSLSLHKIENNVPSNDRVYAIKVNTTFDGIDGQGSVNFTVNADTTIPIINGTLNKSIKEIFRNDMINATFNVTDETGLSFCQIIINQSGFNETINISLNEQHLRNTQINLR